MTTVQVRIPFVLAPHQAVVRNSPKRHRVMACGRRSGKTLGAVYKTVEFLTTHADAVGWWVAPTYGLTRKGMRETIRFLRHGQKHLVAAVNRTEKRIEFTNGSFLEFHTADNPDSLRGEGLDWVVVDEAAHIADGDVWSQYLQPALADREGRALFISSPNGRNWFYDLYMLGQRDDPQWASWNIPTSAAGFVRDSELADLRRSTPERIWQQEYMAQFLEGEGAVFRKVTAAIAPPVEPGPFVVLGIDLARVRDWTVVWAVDDLGRWIAWDRFQDVDWAIQRPRIVNMYKRLRAQRALIDVTGMHVGADPVADQLRADGLVVEPVTLDGSTKRAVVENAMTRFDNGALTLPNDPVVLDEFQRYTYTALPSGRERYGAPSGEHDDIVMAACLAWWGIRQFTGRSVQRKVETEVQREIREMWEERMSSGRDGWTT